MTKWILIVCKIKILRLLKRPWNQGSRSHMHKTYLQLIMQFLFYFLTEDVHIWHTNCLWFVF